MYSLSDLLTEQLDVHAHCGAIDLTTGVDGAGHVLISTREPAYKVRDIHRGPVCGCAYSRASTGHALTSENWQQYVGAGGPGMPIDMPCQP